MSSVSSDFAQILASIMNNPDDRWEAFRELSRESRDEVCLAVARNNYEKILYKLETAYEMDFDRLRPQMYLIAKNAGHARLASYISDPIDSLGCVFYTKLAGSELDKYRMACLYGYDKLAKWILRTNPDIAIYDKIAFENACRKGYLDIVKHICENTPDDNFKDALFQKRVLELACESDNFDLFCYLSCKYDINLKDFHTDLVDAACRHGNWAMAHSVHDNEIEYLDLDELCRRKTFETAVQAGYFEVATFLADIDPRYEFKIDAETGVVHYRCPSM